MNPQIVTLETFMANGPHTVDRRAVLESGMIISDANRWAFLAVAPTPVYSLRGGGRLPLKKRTSYVVQKTPPDPSKSAHLQRRYGALDTVRERSAMGLSYGVLQAEKRSSRIQWVAVGAAVMVMGLAMFQSFTGGVGDPIDLPIREDAPAIEDAGSPLPPDIFNPQVPTPTPVFQFRPTKEPQPEVKPTPPIGEGETEPP